MQTGDLQYPVQAGAAPGRFLGDGYRAPIRQVSQMRTGHTDTLSRKRPMSPPRDLPTAKTHSDARSCRCAVVTAYRINHLRTRAAGMNRFGTDLALSPSKDPSVLEIDSSDVTVKETRKMNPVALLTPTHGRDLELCTLLCESVDRHVGSFSKHYLLVPDCDLSLFAHFESDRRKVLPASMFLPNWLRPL